MYICKLCFIDPRRETYDYVHKEIYIFLKNYVFRPDIYF